ncbi:MULTISPECIES: iron-containing alcohol dehydrogenase [Lysinibacillus]|uniref:iron-containing alcohol dehydrogenase n=1 Tax=Lysinibacillus TaxID=400634 RepID=UPI00257ADC0A|nr:MULTISPECIES: iron-containing alcohol dehydrogenase [Lysinibacillus]
MNAYSETVFNAKTKIYTGVSSIKNLGPVLQEIGAHRILMVTDQGIKHSGILKNVLGEIPENMEVLIYDEVKPNPDVASIDETANNYRKKEISALVAVGGGSVIDSAKALAIVLTNESSISTYYGFDQYTEKALPLIAIPTTVGTGSESGNAAVITDETDGLKTKKLVFGEDLFPRVAILDASLLRAMPSGLIASTGMDALTHAIEGYVSIWSSHFTDALNLHAVRVIGKSLLPAIAHSENTEAMHGMLLASSITGLGMANSGLGMVHGISHAIGAQYDAPHGIVNAILLPYLLEYNWIANPEKFKDIAEALRVNIEGLSVEEAAKAAVAYVKNLTKEAGIPEKLSAIGVSKEHIDVLVDIAFHDAQYMVPNPRKMSRQDIYNILDQSI